MQSYILLLLGILVFLLIGVIYFGWRRIISLEIENNKNKYDIEALRGLLSKILSESGDELQGGRNSQLQNAEMLEQMQQMNQMKQQMEEALP